MSIKLSHGTLSNRNGIYQLNFSKNAVRTRISTGMSNQQDGIIKAEEILSKYFRNTDYGKEKYIHPSSDKPKNWNQLVSHGGIHCKSWLRLIHSRAKHRSKLKGIKFNLSFDDVKSLALKNYGHCEITNLQFSWQKPNNCNIPPYAPSLDRIDAKKGYLKSNCRFVCYSVNIALSDWGEEAFSIVLDNWSKSLEVNKSII